MTEPRAVELVPGQPAEIVAAVAAALGSPPPAADPWWQAGLDESRET